jgi:hypothetical protein
MRKPTTGQWRLLAVGTVLLGCVVGGLWILPRGREPETMMGEESLSISAAHGTIHSAALNRSDDSKVETLESSNPAEENAKISRQMDLATRRVQELERRVAQPVKHLENDTFRIAYVFVPALTEEQLDPIFDELSKAAGEYAPASSAGRGFRDLAAAFLRNVQPNQAKLVSRAENVLRGDVTYVVYRLRPNGRVTERSGMLLFRGKDLIGPAVKVEESSVRHLFVE